MVEQGRQVVAKNAALLRGVAAFAALAAAVLHGVERVLGDRDAVGCGGSVKARAMRALVPFLRAMPRMATMCTADSLRDKG